MSTLRDELTDLRRLVDERPRFYVVYAHDLVRVLDFVDRAAAGLERIRELRSNGQTEPLRNAAREVLALLDKEIE